MPLAKRIIPCLDVAAGRVVKGVKFVNIRDAGDPATVAARYDEDGADEIVLLDITASSERRDILLDTVYAVAVEVNIPLTVGGGVRKVEDFETLLRAGADKVSINSAAVDNPPLLADCARRFGAQCVVLAVDAKRRTNGKEGWEVLTHGGRQPSGKDAVEWVRQAEQLGIGEVLLTSMDGDGTLNGYDLALTKTVAAAAGVPIIASGGAGKPAHLAAALTEGCADAALAASIFHDGAWTIRQVKEYLRRQSITIRP